MRLLAAYRSIHVNDLHLIKLPHGDKTIVSFESEQVVYPPISVSDASVEVEPKPFIFVDREKGYLEASLDPFEAPLRLSLVKDFVAVPLRVVALNSRDELIVVDLLEHSIDVHRIDHDLAASSLLIPRDHNHELVPTRDVVFHTRLNAVLQAFAQHSTITLYTRAVSRTVHVDDDLTQHIDSLRYSGHTLTLRCRESLYSLLFKNRKLFYLGELTDPSLNAVASCANGALLSDRTGRLHVLLDGHVMDTGVTVDNIVATSSYETSIAIVAEDARGLELLIFDFDTRTIARLSLESSNCRAIDLEGKSVSIASGNRCTIYEVHPRDRIAIKARTLHNVAICALSRDLVLAITRNALVALRRGDDPEYVFLLKGYNGHKALIKSISAPAHFTSLRPLHTVMPLAIIDHVLGSSDKPKRLGLQPAKSVDVSRIAMEYDDIVIETSRRYLCATLNACLQPLTITKRIVRIPVRTSVDEPYTITMCLDASSLPTDIESIHIATLDALSGAVEHHRIEGCLRISLKDLMNPVFFVIRIRDQEIYAPLTRSLIESLSNAMKRPKFLESLRQLCRVDTDECLTITIGELSEQNNDLQITIRVRNLCGSPIVLVEPIYGSNLVVSEGFDGHLSLRLPSLAVLLGRPYLLAIGCGVLRVLPLNVDGSKLMELAVRRALKVLTMLGHR